MKPWAPTVVALALLNPLACGEPEAGVRDDGEATRATEIPAARGDAEAQETPERPTHVEPVSAARDLGSAAHLDRFAGVYGDPAAQDRLPRNFFVDQDCDGQLRFGAMWGDVAPWVMKPLSDLEFEQAVLQPYETEPIRLEFHVDASGRVEGLTHTMGQEARIDRLGDLPELFDDREC